MLACVIMILLRGRGLDRERERERERMKERLINSLKVREKIWRKRKRLSYAFDETK